MKFSYSRFFSLLYSLHFLSRSLYFFCCMCIFLLFTVNSLFSPHSLSRSPLSLSPSSLSLSLSLPECFLSKCPLYTNIYIYIFLFQMWWLSVNALVFYYSFRYYGNSPQYFYLHQMLGVCKIFIVYV